MEEQPKDAPEAAKEPTVKDVINAKDILIGRLYCQLAGLEEEYRLVVKERDALKKQLGEKAE